MTLERGTLLHKRYRIVEILGQGGMGSVYRAVDENLGVDVAVKENLFTTDEYARQFRLEAVILASLRHPNLPRVSDHFAVGDQGQYLIMDFIEGEDLRQRMERMGTITEEDAVMVGAAMCDALGYLHSRKPSILHRDIKPGNVKITPDGNIYLVDFGLAKLVQGTQATTTGARAMTPGYSPPEQYGTARTDPRTDIYSLGATLYAGLTGMIPEDGLARAMDNAQLTPLRKRNSRVSRRLAAVIEKAMAVDPADRWQTAEEFKKALLGTKSRTERDTGEFTVSPPPPGTPPPQPEGVDPDSKPKAAAAPLPVFVTEDQKVFVAPKKRRRRSPLGLILLFILIIAGAAAYVLYPSNVRTAINGGLPFYYYILPTVRAMVPLPGNLATSTPTPTRAAAPTDAVVATRSAPSPTPTSIPPSPTATATLTPTSTPMLVFTETPTANPAAAIGGGPGQIAFASDRSGIPQIYLSSLDGSSVALITKMSQGACEPSWSPDGRQFVFVSPCPKAIVDFSAPPPSDTVLYIANADGTNPTALPTKPGGDSEPAWSPDGKRIAFTSLRDGQPLIYIMDLTKLADPDQGVTRLLDPAAQDPSTQFDQLRQPSWSPSGDQLLFVKQHLGAFQIWTVPWTVAESGQGEQQRVGLSGQTLWDFHPVWSPDGKDVLFTERAPSVWEWARAWEMFIPYEQRNTSNSKQVQMFPMNVRNVHFSPDGQWMVYEGNTTTKNPDIYYAPIDGGQPTRLTTDPGVDFDPAWRP
ncbi:MAG TPA: protein kinase [Anaerolineales bacterium]